MFKKDFSSEKPDNKIWFIHEMVHVWQYQLGYWVFMNGLWRGVMGCYSGDKVYKYDIDADKGKSLNDFNFEQQADVIAHYFAVKYLKDDRWSSELPFLENVLNSFLRNPKNAKLLPK
ncbi:MAG: hypothetical protein ACYDGO_08960 [Smithellaceae bacterium]